MSRNTQPISPIALSRRGALFAGLALAAVGAGGFSKPGTAVDPAAAARLAELERRHGGRLGVFALDAGSGRSLSHRGDERFLMCSSFKASLAAAVLARVDRGEERLNRRIAYGKADLLEYAPVAKAHLAEGSLSVEQLCAGAVQVSDNTCANLLLRTIGGPQALTRFWRGIGDPVTRLDYDEPKLNRTFGAFNTTTPRAAAHTLKAVLLADVLKPSSRAMLVGWMQTSTTGPRRLRAGFPGGWAVAHKTGTSGGGLNVDIAMVRPPHGAPLLVASYYDAPKLDDKTRDAVLAEAARVIAGWRG